MNDPVEKRNSVKDKLLDLLFPCYLFLYGIYLKLIIKIRVKQGTVVYAKAYIDANSLFPDSTLDENHRLARLLSSNLLDIKINIKVGEIKEKHVNLLQDKLLSSESVKNDIANYFLIIAFYYSSGNENITSEHIVGKINDALTKARSYKESTKPLAYEDLGEIEKKIKKELKVLKKQIKKINTKKIEEEKSKLIGTIKVTIPEVLILSSAISVLLVVGGILYTTILFYFLDINTSDFFDIYDYISNSVDVIYPVLLISIFLMFFYFIGASHGLSRLILARQFNSEPKYQGYGLKVLVVLYVITFFLQYYYYKIFSPYFLIPIAFFSFHYIAFDLIKLDKYIKNKFAFQSGMLFIFCFFMYLGLDLASILYDIKNGNYQSQYVVYFEKEYEEYSDHKFFKANSKYVFLLNDDTQEIAVIPITGIKSMKTKKSP